METAFPVECNSTGWNVSDPSVSHHPDIGYHMWIYFGTCVFVVGIIGNSLTLVVMTRDDMRGTSTSSYLVSMASVNILLLVAGMIPEWLKAMGIVNLREVHPVGCKLHKFLEYTFGDAAVWIIVLFTIDRCIAICDPFKRINCCSPGYAKFYSIGALLTAIVKNMHVFWTRGAEYRNCVWIELNVTHTSLFKNCGYPTPEYAHFETYVRPWIALALVNIGPFCVIFVCNLIIIHAMIRMKRLHAKHSAISHGQDKVFQTTALCLAASISFLVCVTPGIVLLIGKPHWSVEPTRTYVVFKSTMDVFYYVNYSINFFLYCLTGQKFRETLLATLLYPAPATFQICIVGSSLLSTAYCFLGRCRRR